MSWRLPTRLPPLVAVGALAAAAAALRFVVAVRVRAPLFYPDEYIHTALARSVSDGTFPHIRDGSVSFFSYLGPLLMSPAWFVDDVEVAYPLAQALGCIAFASAAFPAYALARRIGASTDGAVIAALLALVIPGGAFTVSLLAEPYAYPLLLLAVLVALDAIAAPTVWRQLAVCVLALALPLVGGAQFVVFGIAYLPAALFAGSRSLRGFVREQAVVLGAVAVGAAALVALVAAGGSARLEHTYETATLSFDYPLGGTVQWFGVNLFVLAIASGWVIVPGAAIGFWRLAGSADPRRRAFGALSVLLLALMVLEASPFGVNADTVLERYAFYGAPLVAIAFVWAAEEVRFGRAFVAVALIAAVAALLLPVVPPLLSTTIDESPTLLALSNLDIGGAGAAVVWGPVFTLLALLVAWRGADHPRLLGLGAVAVCVLTSAGVSRTFVDRSQGIEILRVDVPHGAAFVTWAGAAPFDLMDAMFWNRDLTRVLIVGGGSASDTFPYTAARLASPGRFVRADGEVLRGPFVFGADTVVADRGTRSKPASSPLGVRESGPALLAFGWDRRSRFLGLGGWIGAAADDRPGRLTIRLRSVDGKRRTLRLRCEDGEERRIEFGRKGAGVLRIPRNRVRECRFALSGASIAVTGGQPRSVVGDLLVVPAAR